MRSHLYNFEADIVVVVVVAVVVTVVIVFLFNSYCVLLMLTPTKG